MQDLYLQELYESIEEALLNNDLVKLEEFNQNDIDYVKNDLKLN